MPDQFSTGGVPLDQATVNVENLFVTYTDSHFILIESESEDDARKLKGKVLGHYLSSDKANEAKRTMRTIAMLGFGHALRHKS